MPGTRAIARSRAGVPAQDAGPLHVLEGRSIEGLRSLDDHALFDQLRAGNELAFSVFYERYRSLIYSFILQRVRNHADAEELVQETFAAVFLSIGRYSGKAAPLAWVYGVAKNTTYNRLRLQKRRTERMAEIHGDPLSRLGDNISENPEAQMECRRTLEELCTRLEMMRPWQIEVFVLRHVDNLPIREIAARVNRSNDAIRSSLYRMKRHLTAQGGRSARLPRPTTSSRLVP